MAKRPKAALLKLQGGGRRAGTDALFPLDPLERDFEIIGLAPADPVSGEPPLNTVVARRTVFLVPRKWTVTMFFDRGFLGHHERRTPSDFRDTMAVVATTAEDAAAAACDRFCRLVMDGAERASSGITRVEVQSRYTSGSGRFTVDRQGRIIPRKED